MFALDNVVSFGKYKGKTVKEIIDIGGNVGKNYLTWASENLAFFKLTPEAIVYMKTGKIVEEKSTFETDEYWEKISKQPPNNNSPF